MERKLKALCTLCRFLSLNIKRILSEKISRPVTYPYTKSELILSENSDRRQSRTVSRCCNFRNNLAYMRRKLRYYNLVKSFNARNNRVSRIRWTSIIREFNNTYEFLRKKIIKLVQNCSKSIQYDREYKNFSYSFENFIPTRFKYIRLLKRNKLLAQQLYTFAYFISVIASQIRQSKDH